MTAVPAVAVKDAVDEPGPIETLAGTNNAPLLLDNETVAPDGATFVNVTVQFDVAPLAIVDGEQLTELTCTAALTVTFVVADPL